MFWVGRVCLITFNKTVTVYNIDIAPNMTEIDVFFYLQSPLNDAILVWPRKGAEKLTAEGNNLKIYHLKIAMGLFC